jgi:membrane protein implicated in regulation of membrane protease activity
MNIDRFVMAFAGTAILVSVTCALLFNPWWLALATFVGLNLLQSAFTGFCPLAIVLRRLGFQAGTAF